MGPMLLSLVVNRNIRHANFSLLEMGCKAEAWTEQEFKPCTHHCIRLADCWLTPKKCRSGIFTERLQKLRVRKRIFEFLIRFLLKQFNGWKTKNNNLFSRLDSCLWLSLLSAHAQGSNTLRSVSHHWGCDCHEPLVLRVLLDGDCLYRATLDSDLGVPGWRQTTRSAPCFLSSLPLPHRGWVLALVSRNYKHASALSCLCRAEYHHDPPAANWLMSRHCRRLS